MTGRTPVPSGYALRTSEDPTAVGVKVVWRAAPHALPLCALAVVAHGLVCPDRICEMA